MFLVKISLEHCFLNGFFFLAINNVNNPNRIIPCINFKILVYTLMNLHLTEILNNSGKILKFLLILEIKKMRLVFLQWSFVMKISGDTFQNIVKLTFYTV